MRDKSESLEKKTNNSEWKAWMPGYILYEIYDEHKKGPINTSTTKFEENSPIEYVAYHALVLTPFVFGAIYGAYKLTEYGLHKFFE